jgi:hypothetical protein
MTWFKFLGWLAGLYALYYVFLVLWDIARGKQGPAEQGWTQELHFEGGFQPQVVSHDLPQEANNADNAVSALGGVTLKGLFDLAKAKSIEYTRGVPF